MKRNPLFRLIRGAERRQTAQPRPQPRPQPRTLAEVRPGDMARVIRFSSAAPAWQERLLAHGVAPGCVVHVTQHQPVTIIQIDNTELGFERDLARAIEVEAV